jgi:ATP-binding cassette subfamily F protein 3
MAVLLQLRNAEKSYGDQLLLDNADVTLIEDVKVGFVGRNGAGKSTLLRVLLGEEELDSGEVIRHPQLRIGYLRQHDPFLPGESAHDFLMRDSGQPDWKCGEVAGEFEIKGDYLFGPVQKLSGGWQTRVKLAALLLHEPNLLMLDEPTNFLDLRTQILLEHFLKDFKQACLIVSHDRTFLEDTCDHTLELAKGKLTMFSGSIEKYLEFDRERRERDERTNAAIEAKQKQLQRFIDKNKARASTATQAKSKEKQLARLEQETVEITSDLPTAHIRAPLIEPRQGVALRVRDLAIGYPEHTVARDITFEIEHGERVAIVGDNGQGKTTLLRTLVNSLPPKAGEVKWGYGCDLSVYAQHVYTTLPQTKSVIEYLDYVSKPGTTNQQLLTVAGAMLFREGHTKKKISVLSGGERARLCMAGIMLGTSNVLILDEPGNHLDVETVESLVNALHEYKGTVIFTSHDRHFVNKVATSVIEVRDGTAKIYPGGYEAYLYFINKEIEAGERDRAASRGKPAPQSTQAKSGKKDKQPALDEKQLRKELKNLEKEIARLDARKKELSDQLGNTADAKAALEIHNELTTVTEQLDAAESRWCELMEDQW